MSRKYKVWYSE